MDAGINASRAKTAEALVRPLKDDLVDVHFDQEMTDALRDSLKTVPGLQMAGVNLTKDVDSKSYMATYRASNAGTVMYLDVDSHLSVDFSTLEVSARGMIFPRKVTPPAGGTGDLVAEHDGGQLMRFPDGTLHYFTQAVALAAPATPTPPVATPALAPASPDAPATAAPAATPAAAAAPAAPAAPVTPAAVPTGASAQ